MPDEAFERGLKYMASCRDKKGAYGYTGPAGPRVTLTAIGSLPLSLARLKTDPSFKESPVSYTHLDVYKRQVLDRAGELVQRAALFLGGHDVEGQHGQHGDVYKRQSFHPSGARLPAVHPRPRPEARREPGRPRT